MGVLTIIVFPALGYALHWLLEDSSQPFLNIFESSYNWFFQILAGGLIGLAFGIVAWKWVKSQYMRPVLNKYGQIVKSLKLRVPTIIFLSFCAGFGEEFFFRGVLQDYLGVFITAIVFVLIHGYLNPFDRVIFTYGLLMTLLIIAIGYLDVYFGLIAAMAAHMMIDVVLFYQLTYADLCEEKSTRLDAEFDQNNL